jgi:hypothetical protein
VKRSEHEKNPQKLFIGASNSPRFAYKCGERSSALPWLKHSANTIGATLLKLLHLFFQNSPIIWAVLTGNENMAKPR